jgi:hypothetical protein
MSTSQKPRIALLTFCVGADYKKAMEPGLASKRAYAARHGYDFHTDGEDIWDHSRPISWSKLYFILKYLDDYDYVFLSDADAIILNHDLPLETHILPLLPIGKDILWTYDACNHYNAGHLLVRGRSAWARDYFNRCLECRELTYHIWWDNAAMVYLFDTNPADQRMIETCRDNWLFNSYVFGPKDTADDPSTRLYRSGDFLIHFAGVYDVWNIYRMMLYVARCAERGAAPDPALLDSWRKSPPVNKAAAEASFNALFPL